MKRKNNLHSGEKYGRILYWYYNNKFWIDRLYFINRYNERIYKGKEKRKARIHKVQESNIKEENMSKNN